jgi:hypothetical protein
LQGAVGIHPALRAVGELTHAAELLLRFAREKLYGVAARLGSALAEAPALRPRYLGPLHARSRALRGASVTLHAAAPCAPSELAHHLSRFRGRRDFHSLEITVSPLRPGLPAWRPGDLEIVGPGALPLRPEWDDAVGTVYAAAVWRAGRFSATNPSQPVAGAQRLRLQVGMLPGERRFHFRYYLELLYKRRARAR